MVPGRLRCEHRNRLIGTKDSPTRFRFRPPLPVTFALRLRPPPAASSYLRPVVGARGNLGAGKGGRKGSRDGIDAICGKSKCPHLHRFFTLVWTTSWGKSRRPAARCDTACG